MLSLRERTSRILKEADLPLEVVILLVAGMIMLISGVLLIPVSRGILPYHEGGLYGLLLVVFALQIITLGKTPIGDLRRSKALLSVGTMIAAMGITTCFVPGVFDLASRILLFICLVPGGLFLLLQMFLSREKFRAWAQYGGIFRHLIVGCGSVYGLSVLIGLLVVKPGVLKIPLAAPAFMSYGSAIVYLALVLRKVYLMYPEAETSHRGSAGISVDKAMILLMGVFMLLLGVLLIPVNLGLLPFSAGAQLGLLMVIFAVQMLAFGNTPLGPFFRSWLVIFFGFLFAALGIVSCVIPDILVSPLTVFVGVLNILGGVLTLGKTCRSLPEKPEGSRAPFPPVLVKLFAAMVTMNLVTILFGASMLVSHLIDGLIIGVILAVNGCLLLYLMHLLIVIEEMERVKASTP